MLKIVDHGYLFSIMKSMGFGDRFIAYIYSLCMREPKV